MSFFLSDREACLDNPCHNNGTCIYMGTTYECQCLEGFEGRYCDTGAKTHFDKRRVTYFESIYLEHNHMYHIFPPQCLKNH